MTAISANDTGLPAYDLQDDFMVRTLDFIGQCDRDEKVALLNALDCLAEAKSESAGSRCMNEFRNWYLERRGLPPLTPKRVAGRGAEKP